MSTELHLIALATALPARRVGNDFFGEASAPAAPRSAAQSKMFLGTKFRRHMDRDEEAVGLFVEAAKKIADERKIDLATEVDAILTNVSLPDMAFTGCGAILAQRLGLQPRVVMDLHNGGCVSFIVMMEFARGLMRSHGVRRILICTGQTAAGRIFGSDEIRVKPQSAVPGDGAAVALFGDEGPVRIESLLTRCHPEFASDMVVACDSGRKYWETGDAPIYLDFPEGKISTIIMRGNRLVPGVMAELCKSEDLKKSEIDGLITNQPNPFFLRNWREALELPAEKHYDTFEEYGNLFQAGIPVTLDETMRAGKLKKGDRLMLAGFSHAGDYSAAAILRF
jgi:3-oxoacyl-[acyl-carrier-protein] synthase-3